MAAAAVTAVAVTGDVGAGKSTVSRLLSELSGGVRIDADAVAKDMWRQEDVAGAAVKRWGGDILDSDGNIIPGAVASHIFSNAEEYRWCCGLLHPLVREELRRRFTRHGAGLAIIEIPLLFEVGRPDWINRVIFVTAPRVTRIERCAAQRGWAEAELSRRERFFMPSMERQRLSDFVINNDGDLEKLKKNAAQIMDNLKEVL